MENFSLWCDFIEREFLQKDFQDLLNQKAFNGATSNPAIFANALKNPIYQESIKAQKGKNAKLIYENLAVEDIRNAAKSLRPLWEKNRDCGYISLEIDPFLEDKVGQSIDEGKRLFKMIDFPNAMIKVPATESGFEVMQALMSEDIPVNATLIFSKDQAKNCVEAFKQGRKQKETRGVISVFVSRFDRAVDHQLPQELQSKLGIYNAQECYLDIQAFGDPYTRTLFASTGVKGGSLAKDYYIQSLLHPHSINTAPLDTILAHLKNPQKITQTFMPQAHLHKELQKFESLGISRQALSNQLLQEGLNAFKEAFEALLKSF